jgi:hypothetical protein
MKSLTILISLILLFLNASAQNNDYFGSVLIPKNEYKIKLSGTNLFWEANNSTVTFNQELSTKIMFIPAGRGYYYIKFLHNNKYLTVSNKQSGNITDVYISSVKQTDNQKFKIVSKGQGKYEFVSVNNLVLGCNACDLDKKRKLQLWQSNNNNRNQLFEIFEFASNKKI